MMEVDGIEDFTLGRIIGRRLKKKVVLFRSDGFSYIMETLDPGTCEKDGR